MRTFGLFALGWHALIPANFAGHVVLLQLLQDNIFEGVEFRSSLQGLIRQTG
jgi:hypothetical protein